MIIITTGHNVNWDCPRQTGPMDRGLVAFEGTIYRRCPPAQHLGQDRGCLSRHEASVLEVEALEWLSEDLANSFHKELLNIKKECKTKIEKVSKDMDSQFAKKEIQVATKM